MSVSDITEADVIGAAIEQLSKKDGYDSGNYFSLLSKSELDEAEGLVTVYTFETPGPDVGATCAIGGVEQAIWRLTGQVVTNERYDAAYHETAASKRHVSQLYAKVMRRLNSIARAEIKQLDLEEVPTEACAIEELTFIASKRVVLNVFKKALAQAQASA
jgi:hypothetical protein